MQTNQTSPTLTYEKDLSLRLVRLLSSKGMLTDVILASGAEFVRECETCFAVIQLIRRKEKQNLH